MNPATLISIKAEHVINILSGDKTIELRRRIGKHIAPGAQLIIYTSSPVKAITATARVRLIEHGAPADIDKATLAKCCVSSADVFHYAAGLGKLFLIHLEQVTPLMHPIPLAQLRSLGITPPQSYRYAPSMLADLVQQQNPTVHQGQFRVVDCSLYGPM
ncbi:hypothetical protein [Ferrimonas marina]|uniref:Predicted transcriptional regulator, contains an HTH and PUA-like domains n=1 Tax=Ferrimonas marina TaxID=299255 RepID=A0A1M5UBD5_9GAMM|nr:hypothetical protein [Ferrimonas marina]SHH60314.1 Predicted transcriptional regulator, contains an HTH and PUA-like domains [Ferrimonas marina]